MEPANQSSPSPANFETAFEQLRAAVDELETGPLPLQQALERYEAGMRLARLCNEMLDQAEIRIQQVLRAEAEEY